MSSNPFSPRYRDPRFAEQAKIYSADGLRQSPRRRGPHDPQAPHNMPRPIDPRYSTRLDHFTKMPNPPQNSNNDYEPYPAASTARASTFPVVQDYNSPLPIVHGFIPQKSPDGRPLRNRWKQWLGSYDQRLLSSGSFAIVTYGEYCKYEYKGGKIEKRGLVEGGSGVVLRENPLAEKMLELLPDLETERVSFTDIPKQEAVKEILNFSPTFNGVMGCTENVWERYQSVLCEDEYERTRQA